MSASTLPSSLCNCISRAVSTSWRTTPKATPNSSNVCAVSLRRMSSAKPPAVTNRRSFAPCKRRAFPSASSKPDAFVTSPVPKASAPRPIPLMPQCCRNMAPCSTRRHDSGLTPTAAPGRAGPAPPPAHPPARQRTQSRRALHRFVPGSPVPATHQSLGKTNHTM